MSLILLGTILIILISTNQVVEKYQNKKIKDDLRNTEDVVRSIESSRLFNLKTQSQLVGELPILTTVIDNGDLSTIKDAVYTYRENLKLPIVDVFDEDGGLLTSIDSSFSEGDKNTEGLVLSSLDGNNETSLSIRDGKLALLGSAPIGIPEEPSGVVVFGSYLDDEFARTIKELTNTDISIVIGGEISSTSLLSESVGHLKDSLVEYSDDTTFSEEESLLNISTHVLHVRPVRDSRNVVVAHAVDQMSLDESIAVKRTIRSTLLGLGLVVFIIAVSFGYWFSNTLTTPIRTAIQFAKNLAHGDTNTPIEVNRHDELGVLQKSLEQMRLSLKEHIDNLDHKVQERTAELSAAQKDIENILNNLESGFLTFDKTGAIQPGYSRTSETFFGKNLQGKALAQIIESDDNNSNSIENWLGILYDELLDFEDAIPLGPSEFDGMGGRHIELHYRPIYQDGSLSRVILIATDKTEELRLLKEAEQEKERVSLIIKISTDRSGFTDFIKDTLGNLDSLTSRLNDGTITADDIDEVFRYIHTIKGNASMYSAGNVTETSHELETKLAKIRSQDGHGLEEFIPELRDGMAEIKRGIQKITDDNKELLGRVVEQDHGLRDVSVDPSVLEEMEKEILTKFSNDSDLYRQFSDCFIVEPFLAAIQKYESVAQRVAERQEKLLKPIVWNGLDVKVRMDFYKPLVAGLVHAFRNAVDHGIETPEEREEKLKDPEGQITVNLEKVGRTKPILELTIIDDGRGIDGARLRTKLTQDGILTAKEADQLSDRDVNQYVFHGGLSTADSVTDVSGRGVGLDAVRHEAERLGGRAWVDSEPGKGVTLHVNVPYQESQPERVQTLLIEDDPVTRKLIHRQFEQHKELQSYELISVSDVESALIEIKELPIKLLITDWMLPNMSGLDFVKFIRANKDYRNLPIIMCSSINDPVRVRSAEEAGVTHYITKPVTKEELVKAVTSVAEACNELSSLEVREPVSTSS